MKNISACLSHKSDEWRTPKKLFEELDNIYHFDIDLAASDDNALCKEYYTKERPYDYQYQPSNKNIYCNPPYSNILQFVQFAIALMNCKNNVVMLIPARTDTRFFHDYIYNKENIEIKFLRGRLKFNDEKGSAPFPSMIVIFKGREL